MSLALALRPEAVDPAVIWAQAGRTNETKRRPIKFFHCDDLFLIKSSDPAARDSDKYFLMVFLSSSSDMQSFGLVPHPRLPNGNGRNRRSSGAFDLERLYDEREFVNAGPRQRL